jgi:choline-sulfatase
MRALMICAVLGCGQPAQHARPAAHDLVTAEQAHAAPEDDGARSRVRFALAEHLERAELREGGGLFIDLGVPGGAKYTHGGWSSQVGPDRDVEGTSAALTIGSRARFALTATAGELAIRLRSFRPGRARVMSGATEIAAGELDGSSWTVLRGTIAEEGERTLTVAFDRGIDVPEIGRAYVAIDWIRLGAGEPSAPPSANEGTLSIPSGWSTGYSMEVPEGARLRGWLEGSGALAVWAHADGAEPRRLAEIADEGRFDVDLSSLAGDVARIELAASGAVALRHPAVVTLDARDAATAARPRNVLVYLIDTLRADRLRVYEPETRVATPGISRFAELASVMLDARSQENWTKPSVATLLSGLMPWEHMAFNDANQVPASVDLLPEILEERGFATAGFVANGYVSEPFGFGRGWDTYRNYIRESQRSTGDRVAADAIAWLDRRPADRPFFLYVHAIDPHVPYRPPREYLEMYDPEPYRGPVDFSRSATVLERIKTGSLRLGDRDRARLTALYDGEVSFQDAQLSSVMDALAHRELLDETIVVITADHGEEFFEHGSVGHGHSLHEELIHVPLIVHVPGLPAQRLNGPVGLVDVMPTVLDALGEPIPEGISGRSLLPMLRGEDLGAPSCSISGFMENWRAVATGRFKIIARRRGQIALYDLERDRSEQNDEVAARPITAAYLRGMLGLRMAEAGEAHHARPRHRSTPATIDPQLREQLEALGYVGTSRPE